ncbi:hypothetical protein HKX48_001811 [Thoreauomyces humboldtii]|nr:hypothetical protein HKX48_001811 [Thoreauomyces humboldtii]
MAESHKTLYPPPENPHWQANDPPAYPQPAAQYQQPEQSSQHQYPQYQQSPSQPQQTGPYKPPQQNPEQAYPPQHGHYVQQPVFIAQVPHDAHDSFWAGFFVAVPLAICFGPASLYLLCCFFAPNGRRGIVGGIGFSCTVVGTIFFILGALIQAAINRDCDDFRKHGTANDCSGTPAMAIFAVSAGMYLYASSSILTGFMWHYRRSLVDVGI